MIHNHCYVGTGAYPTLDPPSKLKANGMSEHVVITGTGRAGTTFLVELLTAVGCDTGFSSESIKMKDPQLPAGLERDIRKDICPFIVKSPWFCDYADDILSQIDLRITHVFVPMRDLFNAAESRRQMSRNNRRDGGLWKTNSIKLGDQEQVLKDQIYKLLLALSYYEVPVTLMQFPKLAVNAKYTYGKLSPILDGVSFTEFKTVFDEVSRPDLISNFEQE